MRFGPGIGKAGDPAAQLGAVRNVGVELAQHAGDAGAHPVDQQVGRRQVELAAELRWPATAGRRPAPPRARSQARVKWNVSARTGSRIGVT